MLKYSQTVSFFPLLFDSRVLLGREGNQGHQVLLASRYCVFVVNFFLIIFNRQTKQKRETKVTSNHFH